MRYETDLQELIGAAFDRSGICYSREAQLGRGRIDFLVSGGVGVEVKKGKPNSKRVEGQIARYCRFDEVRELVVVVERNIWNVPSEVSGKRVYLVSINRQGGLAL